MKFFVMRIPATFFLFSLVIFLEFEESLQRAPTIRLLENAICQRHYQRFRDDSLTQPVEEGDCKIRPIQERLAFLRGMMSLFDGVPG